MSAIQDAVPVRWDAGGLDLLHEMMLHHPSVAPVVLLDDPAFKGALERTGGVALFVAPDGNHLIPLELLEVMRRLLDRAGALKDPAFQAAIQRRGGNTSRRTPLSNEAPGGRQWEALESILPGFQPGAWKAMRTYFPFGCTATTLHAFVMAHTPLTRGDGWTEGAAQAVRRYLERLEDPAAVAAGLLTLAAMAHLAPPGKSCRLAFNVYRKDGADPLPCELDIRGGGETTILDSGVDIFPLGALFLAFEHYMGPETRAGGTA